MISVQQEDFNLANEYRALRRDAPRIGAIVTFSGLVRDRNDTAAVTGLYLEHYPGMTEQVLADLVAQAAARWDIINVRIIHRVGKLKPEDQIVFVGVNSAHRADAFAACEFLMDALKTTAPIWKQEVADGKARWLDARGADQARLASWGPGLQRGEESRRNKEPQQEEAPQRNCGERGAGC